MIFYWTNLTESRNSLSSYLFHYGDSSSLQLYIEMMLVNVRRWWWEAGDSSIDVRIAVNLCMELLEIVDCATPDVKGAVLEAFSPYWANWANLISEIAQGSIHKAVFEVEETTTFCCQFLIYAIEHFWEVHWYYVGTMESISDCPNRRIRRIESTKFSEL